MSTNIDALLAAFTEFASERWDADSWRVFGRGTGTSDILVKHPRLYRSLSFGDDDYPDAVSQVLPDLLAQATGPRLEDKLLLVAEYVPDLVAWIAESGTHRTKKRFFNFLQKNFELIPTEWLDAAADWDFSPLDPVQKTVQTNLPVKIQEQVERPSWPLPAVSQLANAMSGISGAVAPVPATQDKKTAMNEDNGPQRIFIVHGHDSDAVNAVKLFVHKITKIMPEVLADQPGGGDTIIEKFERHADASDYAIVLLTPDDEGRIKGSNDVLQARARQNVILELGYFFGKLGRRNVAVLNGGVEQPSDVHGLNYIAYGRGTWTEDLRAELRHAGFRLI